jgi:hypothetical protein
MIACNDSQIDHIWTNGPTYQAHFGSTQAYPTNLKPIELTNQFVWQSNYIYIYAKEFQLVTCNIRPTCSKRLVLCLDLFPTHLPYPNNSKITSQEDSKLITIEEKNWGPVPLPCFFNKKRPLARVRHGKGAKYDENLPIINITKHPTSRYLSLNVWGTISCYPTIWTQSSTLGIATYVDTILLLWYYFDEWTCYYVEYHALGLQRTAILPFPSKLVVTIA